MAALRARTFRRGHCCAMEQIPCRQGAESTRRALAWKRKVGDPEEAAPSELGKATQTLAQQYMVYYGMWTFSAVVLA